MAIDQGVLDSVVNSNFKILAETVAAALAQAQAIQATNAAAHQHEPENASSPAGIGTPPTIIAFLRPVRSASRWPYRSYGTRVMWNTLAGAN